MRTDNKTAVSGYLVECSLYEAHNGAVVTRCQTARMFTFAPSLCSRRINPSSVRSTNTNSGLNNRRAVPAGHCSWQFQTTSDRKNPPLDWPMDLGEIKSQRLPPQGRSFRARCRGIFTPGPVPETAGAAASFERHERLIMELVISVPQCGAVSRSRKSTSPMRPSDWNRKFPGDVRMDGLQPMQLV